MPNPDQTVAAHNLITMTSLLRGFDATTELQLRILTPPDRSTGPDEYWTAFGRCILADKYMYSLVTHSVPHSVAGLIRIQTGVV